jgi:hypothetical protein
MRKLANAELERKNINEFKEAQKTPIIVILVRFLELRMLF